LLHVLAQARGRGYIGRRIAECRDAALPAEFDPLLALDLPLRVGLIEEEQHGRPLVDGLFGFLAGLYPDDLGAGQEHLGLIARAVGLLLDNLVLQTGGVGKLADLPPVAPGDTR